MKKQNIIFFTWENQVFLDKDLQKWIGVFIQKHWDFNVSKFNNDNISNVNIESELMTPPFLWWYRLVVLEDFPCWKKKDTENDNKKSFDEIILSCLDKIPENNIVIFVESFPDKKLVLYKKLVEVANIKEYKNLEGDGLNEYVRQRLINIDNLAINRLIQYKNSELTKIESEIDKLSLFKINDRITEEDIKKYIIPEIEISIFQLTDAIAEMNFRQAIANLNIILETNSVFQVFSTIMSNLRTSIYIHYLISIWLWKNEIIETLWIHPFLFDKAKRLNIWKIKKLFENLVTIDKKAKTWELIWESEHWLRLAIEKSLLNLKN